MTNLSIGIIGGADGPTKVFVSSPAMLYTAVGIALVALTAIVTAIIFIIRRKKNK